LLYALASKPCSEATNIGYRFSSWAVFGWILIELNNGCGDLGEKAEVGNGFVCSLLNELNSNKIIFLKNILTKIKYRDIVQLRN
jgi:hypothetical protein